MQLLSPAGSFSKLETAVHFGADAVYLSGKAFGLRAKAGNFTEEEIYKAAKYMHLRGKKCYLTVNVYAGEFELPAIRSYLKRAAGLGTDGIIVSDPGIFSIAREECPDTSIFISTQANTTNSAAVNFWADMGVKRVILAREISRKALREIAANARCEIELFVHGAVCVSYSGRCLMSAYMTGRNANAGECAQPCRYNYITEVTRPDAPMEIDEDERGTYLYNAKDLSLIARVPEICEMGVSSVKIEGRMKNEMYVAVVTAVYRQAINRALAGDKLFRCEWGELLNSVSNRHYTEGFYAGEEGENTLNYESSAYVRTSDFLGVVNKVSSGCCEVLCKGKFMAGERLYFFTPQCVDVPGEIYFINGGKDSDFTRAGEVVEIPCPEGIEKGSIIRRFLRKQEGGFPSI